MPQWVAMLNTRVFVLPLRASGVLHHGRELGGLFSHRLSLAAELTAEFDFKTSLRTCPTRPQVAGYFNRVWLINSKQTLVG